MGIDYEKIGLWFAVPAFILTWVACIVYATEQFGWFIGIPLGCLIGIFFAMIAGSIVGYLWPLIVLVLSFSIFSYFVTQSSATSNPTLQQENPSQDNPFSHLIP